MKKWEKNVAAIKHYIKKSVLKVSQSSVQSILVKSPIRNSALLVHIIPSILYKKGFRWNFEERYAQRIFQIPGYCILQTSSRVIIMKGRGSCEDTW